MLDFLASVPNKGHLPCVERMRGARAFLHLPPSQVNKSSIKGMWILRSNPHRPPTARIHRSTLGKIHSIMAGHRSSCSRPYSMKPGDWEKCIVSHSQLVKLQTQGFLPPAYLVHVRAGLATFDDGEQAEVFPTYPGGSECALSLTC